MIPACRIPCRLSECAAYNKSYDQSLRLWLSVSTTWIYADICAKYLKLGTSISICRITALQSHFSIHCLNSNIQLSVGQKHKQEIRYKIIIMWCWYFSLNPCIFFPVVFIIWQLLSCRGRTGSQAGTLPQLCCTSPEGMFLQWWKDWWWQKASLWCLFLSTFTCKEVDSTEPKKTHCLVSLQECHRSFCPFPEKDSAVLHWPLLETVDQ